MNSDKRTKYEALISAIPKAPVSGIHNQALKETEQYHAKTSSFDSMVQKFKN